MAVPATSASGCPSSRHPAVFPAVIGFLGLSPKPPCLSTERGITAFGAPVSETLASYLLGRCSVPTHIPDSPRPVHHPLACQGEMWQGMWAEAAWKDTRLRVVPLGLPIWVYGRASHLRTTCGRMLVRFQLSGNQPVSSPAFSYQGPTPLSDGSRAARAACNSIAACLTFSASR